MKAFRLRALAARVLLLVMVPSVAPSASQGLPSAPGGQALGEKRIRGFNYIASWSGNAVGQWRFYDPAQAELELGYLASIGANSIRVWLSYAVWEAEGAAFLPAGAGGGDVAVHAGSNPPSAAFERRAAELGLEPLGLVLGARGVHAAGTEPV